MPVLADEAVLAGRLAEVNHRIAEAARSAGRSPESVTVVGITKGRPAAMVAAASRLGLRHVGENRVAEAQAKAANLAALEDGQAAGLTWHLVGHLQRNKVGPGLRWCQAVDSLDSPRLAEALDRWAAATERVLPVLLEVNVSGEAEKHGVRPEDAEHVARDAARRPHLALEGVMTLGPLTDDAEAILAAFRRLAALRAELARRVPGPSWHRLSMGMSGDFELAVAAGATELRLGRVLFAD